MRALYFVLTVACIWGCNFFCAGDLSTGTKQKFHSGEVSSKYSGPAYPGSFAPAGLTSARTILAAAAGAHPPARELHCCLARRVMWPRVLSSVIDRGRLKLDN